MKRRTFLWVSVLVLWCSVTAAADVDVRGGLVVCIGGEALETVSKDWMKPGCFFQCLETSQARIANLRKKIRAAGCYGKVSVAPYDGERLPYINNLVNLLIVGPGYSLPSSEVRRVLAPYGIAVFNGKRITKPYPEEMNEWPQYLHGDDNNFVARDMVVGPARHVQWISGPA